MQKCKLAFWTAWANFSHHDATFLIFEERNCKSRMLTFMLTFYILLTQIGSLARLCCITCEYMRKQTYCYFVNLREMLEFSAQELNASGPAPVVVHRSNVHVPADYTPIYSLGNKFSQHFIPPFPRWETNSGRTLYTISSLGNSLAFDRWFICAAFRVFISSFTHNVHFLACFSLSTSKWTKWTERQTKIEQSHICVP